MSLAPKMSLKGGRADAGSRPVQARRREREGFDELPDVPNDLMTMMLMHDLDSDGDDDMPPHTPLFGRRSHPGAAAEPAPASSSTPQQSPRGVSAAETADDMARIALLDAAAQVPFAAALQPSTAATGAAAGGKSTSPKLKSVGLAVAAATKMSRPRVPRISALATMQCHLLFAPEALSSARMHNHATISMTTK